MTVKNLMELKNIAKIANNLGIYLINENACVSLNTVGICICEAEDMDDALYTIDFDGNVHEATLGDVMNDVTLHSYFWTGSPYEKDNLALADYSYSSDISPVDEDVFDSAFSLDQLFDELGIEVGDDLKTPAANLLDAWKNADGEDEKCEVLKRVAELPEVAAKINKIAA